MPEPGTPGVAMTPEVDALVRLAKAAYDQGYRHGRESVSAGVDINVDVTDVPDGSISIPLWRWHILTCHSDRLRALVGELR